MWQQLIALGVGIGVGLYLFLANRQQEEHYQSGSNSSYNREYKRRYDASDADTDQNYPSNCSICFENIDKKRLGRINCGHKFHYECISKWQQTSTVQRSVCPLCREPLRDILRV